MLNGGGYRIFFSEMGFREVLKTSSINAYIQDVFFLTLASLGVH